MSSIGKMVDQKIGEAWNVCVDSEIRTSLGGDENILLIKGATRRMSYGIICTGKCAITNKRIIFESDLRKRTRVTNDIIELNNIKEYCIADSLSKPTEIAIKGVNKDNAIFIKTEYEEYSYSFNPRTDDVNEVMLMLERNCINAVKGEKAKRLETVTSNIFGKRYGLNNIIPKVELNKMSEEEKISMLKEYKTLLDEDIITQEEFDNKKAELLKK